jgi:hypothetical protein
MPVVTREGVTNVNEYVIREALTGELKMRESPVRQFFDSRFFPGLRDVQARYRGGVRPLIVPSVPASAANAGTIGTAADWLLRFLVHPEPSLDLADAGASYCRMLPALMEIASMLGYSGTGTEQFVGPVHGSVAEPNLLYRACWALALLTEVYRGGVMVAELGPIGRLPDRSADGLLAAAPEAGLAQLAALREVFEATLLPSLARRAGLWAPGPTLAGSMLMRGDADLIAGGLLLELKVSAKPVSLGVLDAWQLLGYALMDYTDEFGITDVTVFSARYAYLAEWDLATLLSQLAREAVVVADVREEFRELLVACQSD